MPGPLRRVARAAVFCLIMAVVWADTPARVWQSAEIVAIKQDTLADGDSLAYIYSLRAKDLTYVAVFSAPLKAYIHTTVKFTADKKTLCVQDLDGKSRNADILERRVNGSRQ